MSLQRLFRETGRSEVLPSNSGESCLFIPKKQLIEGGCYLQACATTHRYKSPHSTGIGQHKKNNKGLARFYQMVFRHKVSSTENNGNRRKHLKKHIYKTIVLLVYIAAERTMADMNDPNKGTLLLRL